MMFQNNPYNIFFFIVVIWWFLFQPISAFAHKVTLFAWVDGDTVHTQSKFSGGKRVKGSPILVYNANNKLLLQGKTDKNGMFSFKIPQKTALKIVLEASMGHMAEWTLQAEELGGTESKAATPSTGMEIPSATSSNSVGIQKNVDAFESKKITMERKDIEEIINTSLDKKLRPITQMLANAVNKEPGFTEIMGGFGYIFGLVGVALYFANRKRNR